MHYGDNDPTPEGIITLLSGSYPFLQQASASLTSERTLLLLDEPWRGKTTPKTLQPHYLATFQTGSV